MFFSIIWMIYIFLFILSLVMINGKRINRLNYITLETIIAIVLSLVVYFFSPDYSPDYSMFSDWYRRSADEGFGLSWVSTKDPAFYFMSNFFSYLGFSYDFMNLVICILSISLLMTIMNDEKLKPYIFPILLVYYSRFFYIHDFTQVRFSVAIALSTLGYYSITNKKIIKGTVLILVGSLFHISAMFSVIPICCLFLPVNNYRMKITLSFMLVMVIFSLSIDPNIIISIFQNIPIIYNRILPYFNGTYDVSSIRVITTYFIFKTLILMIVTYLLLNRKKQWDRKYISLVYIIYSSNILSLIFRANDAIALRFVEYFSIFDIIFFIESFYIINENFKKIRINKNVFFMGMTMLTLVWMLSSIKIFKG